MAFPLVAVALAGGAAALGFLFLRRNHVKGQVTGELPGVVDVLSKGRTYAVMVTLTAQDGRNGQKAIGTVQPEVASANIKNVYEVLGFKVLSAPVTRNAGEASDFLHKNPSIWLFNAQWTKDDTKPPIPADFILSQTFVTLPVQ
jgi:hypothetical protein